MQSLKRGFLARPHNEATRVVVAEEEAEEEVVAEGWVARF